MSQTVNLQITLSDEQIDQFIKQGAESINPQQMGDVICECVKEFLLSPAGKDLFIERNSGYYGKQSPSYFLKELLSHANLETALTPVTNEVIDYLKNNYKEVLTFCMMQTFTSMFFTAADKSMLAAELNMKVNKADLHQ